MEALKFRLKGLHAFFKIPEVNSYFYFTYGNIHKVALLGMFGAILGYRGYETQYREYPEFYEKLKELKIAVIPGVKQGCFARKIQIFNNSVGYASQEQGGNLVVKEQWLENPSWTVYVLIDGEESRKLADYILERKCIYMPYLGKNDHPADISDAQTVKLEEYDAEGQRIDSLFPAEWVVLNEDEGYNFKYEESLPIALDKETSQYILAKMMFTDGEVEESEGTIYRTEGKNIIFY